MAAMAEVAARPRLRSTSPALWFVGRAAVRLVVLTWLVASATFLCVRALPGNPIDIYLQDLEGTGLSAADARARAAQALAIDLDQPLLGQYLDFLGNLAHGNLGRSVVLAPGTDVLTMIVQRLPWTLFSVGGGLTVAFLIGMRLGATAAHRRGQWLDHLITNGSAVVDAVPAVLLAVLAVFYLGVVTELVPLSALRGAYAADTVPGVNAPFLLSALAHAVVPGAIYVLSAVGGWTLAMRSSCVSVLGEDYVAVARGRGLDPARIRSAYVGRNARLPLITGFAISTGFVVSGSVLIELIFVYPGVGQLLATALARRDYTVMQGVVIVTTVTVLLTTAIADALYGWIDPRARLGEDRS